MSATKAEEKAALEKIRKIVDGLGEDSYIGTAFEGCFEDAEENIKNDFAMSWKNRAEAAERERKRFDKALNAEENTRKLAEERLANANEQIVLLEKTIKELRAAVENDQLAYKNICADWNSERKRADRAEEEIMRLKAKLYDTMMREEAQA